MHNRILDLVIDLAVQCIRVQGRGGQLHHVCAEFIGLAIGTGRARDGNTVVSAHYNSLESRLR